MDAYIRYMTDGLLEQRIEDAERRADSAREWLERLEAERTRRKAAAIVDSICGVVKEAERNRMRYDYSSDNSAWEPINEEKYRGRTILLLSRKASVSAYAWRITWKCGDTTEAWTHYATCDEATKEAREQIDDQDV
jgi:hypothetical protein